MGKARLHGKIYHRKAARGGTVGGAVKNCPQRAFVNGEFRKIEAARMWAPLMTLKKTSDRARNLWYKNYRGSGMSGPNRGSPGALCQSAFGRSKTRLETNFERGMAHNE